MKRAIAVLLLSVLFIPRPILAQQGDKPATISLHQAALLGNIDIVRQYIKAGSNLDKKDAYGSTPLIIATTFGKTEVAKALIEAGANLNITDNNGSTPLHLAAFFGHPEIVKALLNKGANKYIRNNSGSTALDIVDVPFEYDREIYNRLGMALGPLGLKLNYDQIKAVRPEIADILRPRENEFATVEYAPISRDDWKVSTPREQGLDPLLVSELYYEASKMKMLYSLLIIKNGYLVAEKYFNEGAIDKKTRLASVTKSYTSALIGKALEQGYLTSLDQKMIDFFPEIADKITDPRKKEITIRHLLQMRAGYPWEETDTTLWNGLLYGSYVPLIEEFPLVADPGKSFNYSNLSSNWLGIILARSTGMSLKSYGEKNLFREIDSEVGDWGTDRDGNNNGCSNIHFTSRDVARFGLLYLNDGMYKGKQVLPVSWVRESLQNYSNDAWIAKNKQHFVGRYFRNLGYGYQWWSAITGNRRFNFAWGHGGQLVVLLKNLNMVILATANPFFLQHNQESWKYEQGNINLVGRFIQSLSND